MRALSKLSGIALLAVVVGSCSDAADRALTGPAAASFARLANPTITETLVAEINTAIACAYGQDPKLLARKLREFEHIVELNSRTVRQAEAVRAQVNNFVRDSKRAVSALTAACDDKSPAVAAQELYNALFLLSDQPASVETPEYVGDAEVAVFIPGEELEVQGEGAVVVVPADAYEVPVIISLRQITEPNFDPAPFAAAGTPIVPAYEFSVQPNIAAGGGGVGRYVCVSHAETQLGVLQLFRNTGNGVQGIPNDNSNIICDQENYSQIRNPLLRRMARFASGVTSPFRPKLLYALQHAAIGGPDIFFSQHMVVRVASATSTFCPGGPVGTYASLSDAIAATSPGGTVLVCNGTHEVDSVRIDKPLTLRSENPIGATLRDLQSFGPGIQGSRPALWIDGVTSGTVRIAAINFEVMRGAVTMGGFLPSGAAWDQVVLDSVTITGLDSASTFVVRALPSTVPGAKLEVVRSGFSNLFLGVFAIAEETNVRNASFTNTDRGVVYSFPSLDHTRAGTGTTENSTFNTCGPDGCIRGLGRGGYTIKGNTVSAPTGAARLGGIVVQLNAQTSTLPAVIEDNVVTGARIPATPPDPSGWTFTQGILVGNPPPTGAFSVIVRRNQVSGAWVGSTFSMAAGSDAYAHDNVVNNSGAAFGHFGSGSLIYTRNDATNLEVRSFHTGGALLRDYTCNWWGSTGGPSNVPFGVSPSTYTPWAMQPIAGNPGVVCTPPPPQPDLVISAPGSLVATPNSVPAGGTVTLSPWTVTNQGSAASGGFSTGFYLSTDPVITTGDTYLDGNSNSSLPSGGFFNWGGPTLTIPSGTPPGQYFVGIFVDYTDAVAESDETNNTKVALITVTAP